MSGEIERFDPGEVRAMLTDRDEDQKGAGCILSGKPGCGKTNALVRILERNHAQYGDVMIWRGMSSCQWTRFQEPVKLWFHENCVIDRVINRAEEELIELEDVAEFEFFESVGELVRRIGEDRDEVHVVYMAPMPEERKELAELWKEFLSRLRRRIWQAKISLGIDEFEDIAPLNQPGFHDLVGDLAQEQKELRKNWINTFYSTHRESLVDWRILDKIPWSMYMRKAQVKKERTPDGFSAKRVNSLSVGEAILVGTRFEPMSFGWNGGGRNLIIDYHWENEDDDVDQSGSDADGFSVQLEA